MKKNYIKMNSNKDYLSLGNVIETIKQVSNNNSAMQVEIFSCIFGINNINATTINNYCIGIRAIGLEYKNIFEDNYKNDNLVKNILSICSLLDNEVYTYDNDSLCIINNNKKLKMVIDELLLIAENDNSIDNVNKFIKKNNYETFKELLYYAIIKNNQPLYTQVMNIKFQRDELNEFMKLKLFWGQSYISSLISLANKNNVYACAEVASLEFDGIISGKPNYEKSYYYYMKAANKNHPKACWMVANMMLTKRVEYDFETMWKYLNKSIELGSAAGYNTLGICYLKGINPENKKDVELAKKNFTISSDLGYVYAFNNLGKLYEEENIEEAIKYYKISADMNESWALNKVGEYYRLKGDLKTAFIYYNKAIDCPISEQVIYPYYNLSKYYYENGCKVANIKKDTKKAQEYMEIYNSRQKNM